MKRKQSGSQERAAKRSLAAHKANWTRRQARALAIEATPSAQLQYELLRRAYERGEQSIAALETTLATLRAKQSRRDLELARCLGAISSALKGGAS